LADGLKTDAPVEVLSYGTSKIFPVIWRCTLIITVQLARASDSEKGLAGVSLIRTELSFLAKWG